MHQLGFKLPSVLNYLSNKVIWNLIHYEVICELKYEDMQQVSIVHGGLKSHWFESDSYIHSFKLKTND